MNAIRPSHRFVLGVVAMLLVSGLTGGGAPLLAAAESPPNPAARFTGAVLINGVPPPAGTTIEAKIGVTTCGVGTVFMNGSEARYKLDSPALDPGATPNCGTDGAPVTFYVNGLKADQTGSWRNYDLNQLDLTVTAAETPVASPAATPTPVAPALGNTTLDGGSSASWLAALAGLAAMAASAGLVAVIRRAR
jgi:hypothetical protein